MKDKKRSSVATTKTSGSANAEKARVKEQQSDSDAEDTETEVDRDAMPPPKSGLSGLKATRPPDINVVIICNIHVRRLVSTQCN